MIQYLVIIALGKISYDHFFAYTNRKWLYALAFMLFLCAISYEMKASGCTINKCKHKDNREPSNVTSLSGSEALCAESRRVNWRISYMISFGIFTILNMIQINPKENLTMLIATWALIQGSMGFISHHRYGIWCEYKKD
jgi:hypothetical protein